jgi:hypothetical protein
MARRIVTADVLTGDDGIAPAVEGEAGVVAGTGASAVDGNDVDDNDGTESPDVLGATPDAPFGTPFGAVVGSR